MREAIFTSLARIATAESVAAVLPCLRSDDASLRTGAIDCAARDAAGAAAAHLPRLLADPDADVRLLSCELARGLPDDEATGCCAICSKSETEKNVCAAAVEVLAEIGGPRPCRPWRVARRASTATPFLAFSIKVATDRIARRRPRRRE